jgi:hypothetical protein
LPDTHALSAAPQRRPALASAAPPLARPPPIPQAAFAGHDSLIGALTRHGARIGGSAGDMSEVEVAALLCRWVGLRGWALRGQWQGNRPVLRLAAPPLLTPPAPPPWPSCRPLSAPPSCVFESNLPLLRRLIDAGADANSADYDGRTPLHIAAAEGNSVIVRVLVEEGGARLDMRDRCEEGATGLGALSWRSAVRSACQGPGLADAVGIDRALSFGADQPHAPWLETELPRWNNTPADEARRVGDLPVCEFLEARARAEAEAAAAGGAPAPAPAPAPATPAASAASAAAAGPPDSASLGAPGPAVAAANAAARGGGGAAGGGGRATVDVGAAVQKVLSSGGSPGGSPAASADGQQPAPPARARNAAAAGPAKGGAAPRAAGGRASPPLEPVHKAVAVGHAWSVVMPRASPAGGGARGGGGGGARRGGGGGRGT